MSLHHPTALTGAFRKTDAPRSDLSPQPGTGEQEAAVEGAHRPAYPPCSPILTSPSYTLFPTAFSPPGLPCTEAFYSPIPHRRACGRRTENRSPCWQRTSWTPRRSHTQHLMRLGPGVPEPERTGGASPGSPGPLPTSRAPPLCPHSCGPPPSSTEVHLCAVSSLELGQLSSPR